MTPQAVVETLVESGAKSQSDKRYAASWKNLIKDIEKAAKVSEVHGNKPANVTSEEWALILSHRTRKATAAPKKAAPKKRAAKTTVKASLAKRMAAAAVTQTAPRRAKKPLGKLLKIRNYFS